MARPSLTSLRATALGLALVLAGCGTSGPGSAGARGVGPASAQARTQDRSVVTLRFKDRTQLEALAAQGVDLFENVDHARGTVDASLTAETRAIVKRLGVAFSLKQGAFSTKAFPAGYGSVGAVHAELRQLAQAYPTLVEAVEIGKSVEGRPILAAKITAKPAENLPAVRITGGTHARELVPVELMRNLTKALVEGYGKDATVTRLLDSRQVWIVPVVNPDGRTRVEGGSAMWRKNARPLGMGATGVDINRNADDHWSQGDASPRSDAFRGEAPFSEPETQAIRDLALKVRFKASFDVHCYGGMVLWPPGFSTEFSADEARFKAIGEKIARPLGYRAGTIARTIYKTYGDMATWEYAKLGTLAFAAELNDGEFAPRFGQVDKDWQAWKEHFLFFIDAAANDKAVHPTEGRLVGFVGF
ncbi:MAG: M14 family metallopeptidase [Candidatus Sericytochromatia bacterium]|nr:M14 family metallopeptidase [Candidatus Sericytochromatia bacterium]